MKSHEGFTLDVEVVSALECYTGELAKSLPASMQKGARIRSGVVNDILKEFLQNKGFLQKVEK